MNALSDMLIGRGPARGTLLFATRQRLLTLTSVLGFGLAFAWVTLTSGSVINGRPLVAVLCWVTPFLFLPFGFLAHRNLVNLDVLAHTFLVLLFSVLALIAGVLGGMVSTTSFLLMLLPMLATLLLGIRMGLAWFAIVALTYASLHWGREMLPQSSYEALGTLPEEWMRAEEVSFWNACMMTLLALGASLAVANFRAVVQKSSKLLVQSALETQHAVDARLIAEQLSRSKTEFIANVSHELRTPLNAIIGYSELLLENAEEDGRSNDAADTQRVLEAAARLLRMVNEILQLSAIDAGKHKLKIDECDVSALVDDALAALASGAKVNGNRFIAECNTERGFWLCDGPKLDYCLRHLLANAVKFTRDGVITVRVSQDIQADQSWLRLEVHDTGIGIEPTQIEGLFGPFGMADASVTREQEGIGLGLAVTRQLVRLMGGDVNVRSVPGRGSCFTILLAADFLRDASNSVNSRSPAMAHNAA